MVFCPEFAQKAHGRNLIGLQVTQLTASKTLRIHFTKAQLHRRIPFLLRHTYLGNETWPSFDECYRIGDTFFIEDLGHADLLSNKPFQHAQFSPSENIDETASRASAASSPCSAVRGSIAKRWFWFHTQAHSCTV